MQCIKSGYKEHLCMLMTGQIVDDFACTMFLTPTFQSGQPGGGVGEGGWGELQMSVVFSSSQTFEHIIVRQIPDPIGMLS